MSRVGEKIKFAREKSGMTAKVLAKKMGVAEKYINEVEMGRKVAPESFIDRAAKVLKVDLNDISMVVTDEELMKEKKIINSQSAKIKQNKTEEVWTEAFSSVLKNVAVCDYNLKPLGKSKEMPIHANKIEGYPQDKVFYIEINDDEMSGFRMKKGDIAFCHSVKELTNNGFFLISHNGKRKIRQVKLLGNSKILLISNLGTVTTETAEAKEIEIVAKLERIEINLE